MTTASPQCLSIAVDGIGVASVQKSLCKNPLLPDKCHNLRAAVPILMSLHLAAYELPKRLDPGSAYRKMHNFCAILSVCKEILWERM